jgi:hypothetical protein
MVGHHEQDRDVSRLIAELREYIENMSEKLEDLTSYVHAEIEGVHQKLANVERRLEEQIKHLPKEIEKSEAGSVQVEIPDEWFTKISDMIESMQVTDRSYNERFLAELQDIRETLGKADSGDEERPISRQKNISRRKTKKTHAQSDNAIEENSQG